MPTSAPWQIERPIVVEDYVYLVVSAEPNNVDGPRKVALVGAWDLEGERNARLIVAAPKLLAACQAVVDHCNNGDLAEAIMMCRDAVAEAVLSEEQHIETAASIREIRLPCFGITIRLDRKHTASAPGCGTITSNLKEANPDPKAVQFNAAIDGLESLILAHTCAGIDVEAPAYVEGIETAVEAIGNHL